jgi:hypothetical protein
MTSLKYILGICLLVLPIIAFAQFEGKLEMETSNSTKKENASLNWSIKNGKHHLDIQSKSDEYAMDYVLLVNEGKKEAWFLTENESNKAAYAIPYANLNKSELDIPLNSILKDAESTERIAGFDCKKYQIISGTTIVDCWISNDTGITHSDFPSFMNTGDLLGILKLNKIQGIPLKFEIKNTSGELINGQYINKITAKPISDSQFEVPSDYTKNGSK